MKCLFLKDKKITDDQIERLQNEFADLMKEHAVIDPVMYTEERDFSYYPTFLDSDGDKRPTDKWLRETIGEVYKKYKEDVDHVFIQIHEDHWQSSDGNRNIWGTNYSNLYNGYQVHYCRFDRDNFANSLGVTYHEFMHSPDALIKTYLNIRIEDKLGITSWDKEVTHGAHPDAKYIRHKENLQWLAKIAPELRATYKKRRELYFNTVKRPLMEEIIRLSELAIVLLRQAINKKNGVGR